MEFLKTSKNYSLKKSTYINLRWTAYIGQLITVLIVQFLFGFNFNYLPCIFILPLESFNVVASIPVKFDPLP